MQLGVIEYKKIHIVSIMLGAIRQLLEIENDRYARLAPRTFTYRVTPFIVTISNKWFYLIN